MELYFRLGGADYLQACRQIACDHREPTPTLEDAVCGMAGTVAAICAICAICEDEDSEVSDLARELYYNCLEQAVAERLLLTNPAKGCRLPKLEKREMKMLPEDKIGPYLAEAERCGTHQISRPQTHLRHAVPQVRCGRQDAVRRTGTL